MKTTQRCIALTVLAFAMGCAPEPADTEAFETKRIDDKAARVETMTVTRGQSSLRLVLPGEVEAHRDSDLAAPNGGFVEKLLVSAGERIRTGQSTAYVNRGVSAASLAQAEAQLELAKHEMSIVDSAGDSVSRSRRIRAQAQLKSAEAAYRLAAINTERARGAAPFAGTVSKLYVEEGEVIPPGGKILRLVEMGELKVTLSISDRDVRWVRPGAKAIVRIDGGARTVEAEVSRVSPSADLETRTFIAEIDLENAEETLFPGMMVTAEVVGQAGKDTITIPQYALITRGDANGVFVVRDSKAVWHDVEVGGLLAHSLLISSGLEEGEELITRGHRELSDGEALVVVGTSSTVAVAPEPAPQAGVGE